MRTKDVWVHVWPKYEDGHETKRGADCHCEPIVETYFHLHGGGQDDVRILICLHQHDMFESEIVFDSAANWRLSTPDPFNTHVDLDEEDDD